MSVRPCVDCGEQVGGRYPSPDGGRCWRCWEKRTGSTSSPSAKSPRNTVQSHPASTLVTYGSSERESSECVEESGEKEGKASPSTFPPLSSTFSRGWPRELGEDAYCGLAGEIVHAIESHSEADPSAVLVSLLVMFGNAIGRGPYVLAGDAAHATNVYVCIFGNTSSGRKGTSAEGPRRLIAEADPDWRRCVSSGLVSGEGVIHHVRDPRTALQKAKTAEDKTKADDDGFIEELVDGGADDKRLMVLVAEFAQVLAVIARKDNTLSAVMRDFWDRGRAQTLAKNSPEKATGALVSVLAHITPTELRARLDSTEIANGFANRFIFIAAKRSKLLPRGGSIPLEEISRFAPRLRDALRHARNVNEMDMTPAAWARWDREYERLTTRPLGLVGAITGRAAPMVRRFSTIYAVMDERSRVREEHLLAALELWRYAEESVKYVFGDRLGDQLADRCLTLLREAGAEGLTRTNLREVLGNRIAAERVEDALGLLAEGALARSTRERTGGRSAERWYAITDGEDEGGGWMSGGGQMVKPLRVVTPDPVPVSDSEDGGGQGTFVLPDPTDFPQTDEGYAQWDAELQRRLAERAP